MRYEGYYDSCGEGRIHYYKWVPVCTPKAVIQIVHGIAETAERYEDAAVYFTILIV